MLKLAVIVKVNSLELIQKIFPREFEWIFEETVLRFNCLLSLIIDIYMLNLWLFSAKKQPTLMTNPVVKFFGRLWSTSQLATNKPLSPIVELFRLIKGRLVRARCYFKLSPASFELFVFEFKIIALNGSQMVLKLAASRFLSKLRNICVFKWYNICVLLIVLKWLSTVVIYGYFNISKWLKSDFVLRTQLLQ